MFACSRIQQRCGVVAIASWRECCCNFNDNILLTIMNESFWIDATHKAAATHDILLSDYVHILQSLLVRMCARLETSVSSHCGIGALNFGLATASMMSTPFFSGVVVFLAPGMNADATDPSCMAIIFILHDTIYHLLLACNQASWQSRLAAAEEACGSIRRLILWPPLLDGVI